MHTLVTCSEKETEALGFSLGKLFKFPGVLICLNGPLGTGKTVFARGIALGLGIKRRVVSPTFTLLNIYNGGRFTLYHFDFYRLNKHSELEDLGLEEYTDGEGITIIEWAEKFPALLLSGCLEVCLDYSADGAPEERRISFYPHGSDNNYNFLIKEMMRL